MALRQVRIMGDTVLEKVLTYITLLPPDSENTVSSAFFNSVNSDS